MSAHGNGSFSGAGKGVAAGGNLQMQVSGKFTNAGKKASRTLGFSGSYRRVMRRAQRA